MSNSLAPSFYAIEFLMFSLLQLSRLRNLDHSGAHETGPIGFLIIE